MKKLILSLFVLVFVTNLLVAKEKFETKFKKKKKIDSCIYFDYASDKLHSIFYDELDLIAWSLKHEFKNKKLKIMGYADIRGTKPNNMNFSNKRAKVITDYLTHWHGIPKKRIVVKGFGYVPSRFSKISEFPKPFSGEKKKNENVTNPKQKKMYTELMKWDDEDQDLSDTLYFQFSKPKRDNERLKDRVVIFEME